MSSTSESAVSRASVSSGSVSGGARHHSAFDSPASRRASSLPAPDSSPTPRVLFSPDSAAEKLSARRGFLDALTRSRSRGKERERAHSSSSSEMKGTRLRFSPALSRSSAVDSPAQTTRRRSPPPSPLSAVRTRSQQQIIFKHTGTHKPRPTSSSSSTSSSMGRLAAEPVSVHRKTAGFRSNLAAVAGPGALSEFDQGKHRALLLPSQELRETALTTVYAKVWCGIAERAGTPSQ